MISFVNRYRIKDVANGEQSKDKFRVYPTAVYTALLYNTIDNQVSGIKLQVNLHKFIFFYNK
jgi:hypothetical protein